MKVALVHDFLNQYGGAEKVLESLHELYPDAPIHTSIFIPDSLPKKFSGMRINTSFMQKLPFLRHHFKKYLLLYPMAMENFRFPESDVVISGSSAFAKGVHVPAETCHISYCYTPMRFVWRSEDYLRNEPIPLPFRPFLPWALSALRKWDLRTVSRVHHYVAISRVIQERLRQTYNVPSEVIHPPVQTSRFEPADKTDTYYLIVSRLSPYKRLDIAMEAFCRLQRPLLIIGAGPDEHRLKRLAGKNVTFLGTVPQDTLAEYYRRCKALVFPGMEDFGIAPVEAMASGRPVVAFRGGGATETVREGETGLFFDRPDADSLMEAVQKLDRLSMDPAAIRAHAETFDETVFKRKMALFVESKYADFQEKRGRT